MFASWAWEGALTAPSGRRWLSSWRLSQESQCGLRQNERRAAEVCGTVREADHKVRFLVATCTQVGTLVNARPFPTVVYPRVL